jgi:hypothetical protein
MKRIILLGFLPLFLCLLAAVSARAGWSEPVPVQELNMSGDELLPYLSADGQIMLFSAEGTMTMSHWNGSTWGPREYLPAPINYVGLQDQAAITPDKSWIYWVSWRAGGMGMWDIWRATWNDSSYTSGPAECLGPNINSADIEYGMCFTADGQRMYFVTDTLLKNGQYSCGSMDIWYVDRDSTIGDWGEPVNLGSPVNTTDMEETPSFRQMDIPFISHAPVDTAYQAGKVVLIYIRPFGMKPLGIVFKIFFLPSIPPHGILGRQ